VAGTVAEELIRRFVAESSGASSGTQTLLTIVSFFVGTSGIAVALVQWLSGRPRSRADTAGSIVDATTKILAPYSMALEMQAKQLMEQRQRNQELEARNRELEAMVAQCERLHGPLRPAA
jgi:hypothetical protein